MKKLKLLIVPILIVILLGIGYELLFVRNKDKIVKNSIDSLFNSIEKSIDEVDSLMPKKTDEEGVFHLKQNVNIGTNVEGLESLSKITWKVDSYLDLENSQIQAELGALENGKEIISALLQIINDELIVKSDVLSSPYKTEFDYDPFESLFMNYEEDDYSVDCIDDYSFNSGDDDHALDCISNYPSNNVTSLPIKDVDLKAINNIIKTVHKSFVDNISTERITQTSEEISVRGNNVKVLANKYSISETEAKKIVKAIINNLRTNNMDDLVKITDTNKETLREGMDSFLEEIDTDETNSDETIDLTIYSAPFMGTFKGFKIKTSSAEDSVSVVMDKNEGEIIINSGETYKITIDKEDGKYIFKTTIDDVVYKLEYKEENKETAYYNLFISSDDADVIIKTKTNIKKEDNGIRNDNEIDISVKESGENFSIKLKTDGIIEYDRVFPEKISNPISAENLTEEELENILNRIGSKLEGTSLEKLFVELNGATSY